MAITIDRTAVRQPPNKLTLASLQIAMRDNLFKQRPLSIFKGGTRTDQTGILPAFPSLAGLRRTSSTNLTHISPVMVGILIGMVFLLLLALGLITALLFLLHFH